MFELKDLIYIGVYLITAVSIFVGFKYQIKQVERGHNTLKRVIFQERGGLSFVGRGDCENTKKELQTDIDRISRNIICIMVHLKLTPVNGDNGSLKL